MTGESTAIDVDGLIAGTLDGLLLHGHDLWVVENFPNTLARVSLSSDLSSGEITATITSPLFRVPTTIARHGSRLAAVNARFDLGFPPPLGPVRRPGPTSTSCWSVRADAAQATGATRVALDRHRITRTAP